MPEEKKKQEKIKIVPIADGELHLQNKIVSKVCYICKKEVDGNSVLLRTKGNDMGFACTHHRGVLRTFVEQYNRLPLGWIQKTTKTEAQDATESTGKST
jgi:hypothetical protein